MDMKCKYLLRRHRDRHRRRRHRLKLFNLFASLASLLLALLAQSYVLEYPISHWRLHIHTSALSHERRPFQAHQFLEIAGVRVFELHETQIFERGKKRRKHNDLKWWESWLLSKL